MFILVHFHDLNFSNFQIQLLNTLKQYEIYGHLTIFSDKFLKIGIFANWVPNWAIIKNVEMISMSIWRVEYHPFWCRIVQWCFIRNGTWHDISHLYLKLFVSIYNFVLTLKNLFWLIPSLLKYPILKPKDITMAEKRRHYTKHNDYKKRVIVQKKLSLLLKIILYNT